MAATLRSQLSDTAIVAEHGHILKSRFDYVDATAGKGVVISIQWFPYARTHNVLYQEATYNATTDTWTFGRIKRYDSFYEIPIAKHWMQNEFKAMRYGASYALEYQADY